MTTRLLKIASIAILGIAAAPRVARAQLPFKITLLVPLQMQDLSAGIRSIRVHCTVRAGRVSVKNLDHTDFTDAGPVVNNAYSGTATIVLDLIATEPLSPGQQWTYECYSELVTNTATNGIPNVETPGTADAQLAPTSGPNLIQGTFTTQ
jgi:hypothetical protein